MPAPLDVNSPAYKKALRLHNKSKKTLAAECLPVLREQERAFKARFPSPSLSNTLDLSWSEETHGNTWRGAATLVDLQELRCLDGKMAYSISSLPGFVLLPGYLSAAEQRELVKATMGNHAKHPNENNLDTHYKLPIEGLWPAWRAFNQQRLCNAQTNEPVVETKASSSLNMERVSKRTLIENAPASVENFEDILLNPQPAPAPSNTLTALPLSSIIKKLRWSNLGHFYHWGTKSYQFDRQQIPMPSDIRSLCQRVVRAVPWEEVWRDGVDIAVGEWELPSPDYRQWHETYDPDAGIINFYQLKDTLMAHVDRSELSSTSPLVSISLGQAAVFLLGGSTRDEKAIPVILRSGDVLIMSGPRCRRAFHGVPRILEDTLPVYLKSGAEDGEDWDLIANYLETTRININVRQVFPPGFPYEQYGLSFLKKTKT